MGAQVKRNALEADRSGIRLAESKQQQQRSLVWQHGSGPLLPKLSDSAAVPLWM